MPAIPNDIPREAETPLAKIMTTPITRIIPAPPISGCIIIKAKKIKKIVTGGVIVFLNS